MSDLEDYESDVEPQDDESDKEEKSKKLSTSKKLTQTKIKSDVQDSSGEEDLEDSDVEEEQEEEVDSDELEEEEEEENSAIKDSNDMISNVLSPINSDVESDEEDDLQKFDQENTLPYQKPPLSKSYIKSFDTKEALLRSKEWYVNNKIDLKLNTNIKFINHKNKSYECFNYLALVGTLETTVSAASAISFFLKTFKT